MTLSCRLARFTRCGWEALYEQVHVINDTCGALQSAQKHGEESREEVDSLLNLINRLDFNGWLQRKGSSVDVRTLVESGQL